MHFLTFKLHIYCAFDHRGICSDQNENISFNIGKNNKQTIMRLVHVELSKTGDKYTLSHVVH